MTRTPLILASTVTGALIGAAATWLALPQPSLGVNDSLPSGLEAFQGNGLRADPVDSPVPGLNAWILHTPASPGSTAQLAVSAPGSDGFSVGKLFTAEGKPVNDELIGGDARQRSRFADLGVTTKWVPVTPQEDPRANSVYLFASPLDPAMQSLWPAIDANRDQLPEIRLVPTAYATPNSFEAVLDIFLARHEVGGSAFASRQRLIDYLDGNRQVPQALRDDPTPNPIAVEALSANGNIHHRLRLGEQPTVVAPGDAGGLTIQSLSAYLQAKTGKATELADDTGTPSNHQE